MKKNTLIFGAIFALLLSYFLLVEKKNFATVEPPSRQGPRLFPSVKQADFTYFKIQNENSVVAFRKTDSGDWRMEKPLADRADSVQCENLARSLANLTLLGKIEKKEKLNEYGFNKVSIRLHAEAKSIPPMDMEFGDEDPTNKGIYAFLPADEKIVLVPNFIKQIANKPIAEWRDPEPIHLDQDKITSASFQSPNGTLSFKKVDDAWTMTKPIAQDADADNVQQFLVTFLSIRGMRFVPASEANLFSPFGTFTFSETDKKPAVISLRSAPMARSIRSRAEFEVSASLPSSTSDSARSLHSKRGGDIAIFDLGRAYGVITSDRFIKDLSLNPAHYADRHLVRFNDRLVTKVELTKKNKDYLFEKKGSDWTLNVPQKTRIPPWKAVTILSDLRTIKIDQKTKAPGSFHAAVSLKLWSGNRFIGTVHIGERVKTGKKDLYPARVTPSNKVGMIDAGPLLHDLP